MTTIFYDRTSHGKATAEIKFSNGLHPVDNLEINQRIPNNETTAGTFSMFCESDSSRPAVPS